MKIRNLTLFILVLGYLTLTAPSLGQDSTSQPAAETARNSGRSDFNKEIYYKNKLEFSLETGWLFINIPFPSDVFLGDGYTETPFKSPLVPFLLLFDGKWAT